jgi:lipopolysaccharide assembly outer membrane protein LptD (OstA)
MEGEEVQKTGAETYRFRRGLFTTCRCPEEGRDPWAIRASQADLELGGYGTARNTSFHVLGVPVLWLPWMVYPLKTERETGFLFPELGGSTRSGGDYGWPFFWAAQDELNVLLTPGYVSKRGFKPSLELEYVFGDRSEGAFFGSFVSDRDVDRSDPSTPFSEHRWGVWWRHDQFLPNAWRFKADGRFVSDNSYPFDFHDLSRYRVDRFVGSTGFVERHFGGFDRLGLTAAVQLADDLQSPDDSDRDDVLLQRLPQLELALLPRRFRRIPRVVNQMELRYTHYRSYEDQEDKYPTASVVGENLFLDTGIDGIPDEKERNRAGAFAPPGSEDNFPFGPENDGRFQEGEPLADRGHRLIVSPRLGVPLRLGDLVEFYPEIGYHGTFYTTDEQGFEDRHLATGRLDLRTRLRRSLRLPFGMGEVRHVVEPHLGWALISQTSQGSNPLFVPRTAVPQQRLRQLALDNVTRDPADRIDSFNGIVLGLGNRIFQAAGDGAGPRLGADLSLSAAYNFSGSEWGLLVLDGVVDPLPSFRTRFIFGYDLERTRVAEASFRVGWSSPRGHDLGFDYRFVREVPRFFESYRFDTERFDEFEQEFDRVNQLAVSVRAALTRRWALTYRLGYSFEGSFLLGNSGGVEYVSKCLCWAVGVELADNRSSGFEFRLRYTLLGLGDDTLRPFEPGGGSRFGL